MAFGKQYPFLMNEVTGQVGTFIGTIPVSSEKDKLKIVFVPLGKIKKIISSQIYSKEMIIHVSPLDMNLPGVQTDYVYITSDTKGQAPHIEQVRKTFVEQVAVYKEKLEIQRLETAKEKNRNKELKKSTSKQVAKDLELHEKKSGSREDDFLSLRGRQSYSNYMNR